MFCNGDKFIYKNIYVIILIETAYFSLINKNYILVPLLLDDVFGVVVCVFISRWDHWHEDYYKIKYLHQQQCHFVLSIQNGIHFWGMRGIK